MIYSPMTSGFSSARKDGCLSLLAGRFLQKLKFTPLESPAAGSGDEDKFLLKRTPLEIYL
jgi:hypothetical protein